MKYLFVILMTAHLLMACVSTGSRKPASLSSIEKTESTEQISAVVVVDYKSNKRCLLNQNEFNLRAPAIGSTFMTNYEQSKAALKDVPDCDFNTASWAQKSASVSYTDGPKTAGLLAYMGYYLLCSAYNASLSSTFADVVPNFNNKKNLSPYGKFLAHMGDAMFITSVLVCLPAAGFDKGLEYVFTK